MKMTQVPRLHFKKTSRCYSLNPQHAVSSWHFFVSSRGHRSRPSDGSNMVCARFRNFGSNRCVLIMPGSCLSGHSGPSSTVLLIFRGARCDGSGCWLALSFWPRAWLVRPSNQCGNILNKSSEIFHHTSLRSFASCFQETKARRLTTSTQCRPGHNRPWNM